MREKGQTEVAKTLETPVFSRGIEILTEKKIFYDNRAMAATIAQSLEESGYIGRNICTMGIKVIVLKRAEICRFCKV